MGVIRSRLVLRNRRAHYPEVYDAIARASLQMIESVPSGGFVQHCLGLCQSWPPRLRTLQCDCACILGSHATLQLKTVNQSGSRFC
mmetsp:Transcript_39169/g.125863  ORF Transcript_39169/g.125863 Transcript_39169/m.125863 type:complete len:86 (-) Transcript_39169:21-278(-)